MEGVKHSAYKWVAISESYFCNTNNIINNARSTAHIMRKIVCRTSETYCTVKTEGAETLL